MNTFAKISDQGVVENIILIPDDQVYRGKEFINSDLNLPGNWEQCDVTAYRGKKRDGSFGAVFRVNYPGIGYTYDAATQAFWEPKPPTKPSWVINPQGGFWQPPISRPTTPPAPGMKYVWDEATVSWIQVPR